MSTDPNYPTGAKPSHEIFSRLLQGKATSAEYVTALRAEGRDYVAGLRRSAVLKRHRRDA